MKAYVLEGIGQLKYKEVPMPVLNEGEVLVEVKAAGICGSDIPRIFETGTYHFPTIPGHEFSGVVVEDNSENGSQMMRDEAEMGESEAEEPGMKPLGIKASARWKGKRVGVFPLIPCKECAACQKKQYEMCTHYSYLGSRCDGGFARYVAVPEWNLIELPDSVSYEEAALLEPSSVALHSVRRLDFKESVESAVLLGLGTIGVIITQWLKIYGVSKVFATGHSEDHGKLMQKVADANYKYCNAKETNVPEWVADVTSDKGTDVVFDCVGTSQSLEDAIACVRPGGQIIIVANPKGDVALSKDIYWKILRKQIRVSGTWNSSFTHESTDDWHMVLEKVVSGELRLQELISHRFAFERLSDGLEVMREKKEYRNKIMIVK